MNAAAFGTCTAAKHFRDAGFDERQMEAAVSMVRDAFGAGRGQLATKTDLNVVSVGKPLLLPSRAGRERRFQRKKLS